MSSEHGGGGGGEAKFFIGIIVGLVLIWLFGLYRSGALFEEQPAETPVAELNPETVAESPTPKFVPKPTPVRSSDEPAVTYYPDQEGTILEVVEHYTSSRR